MQLFFDMDGVLAIWNPENTQADTFQPGYFLSRTCDKAIKELILLADAKKIDTSILTATYLTTSARQEKGQWLSTEGISLPVIYVPYGLSKHDFIPDTGDDKMILIDDFSRNLHAWINEGPRHKAVKYLNGVNGNYGTWDGPYITSDMTAEDMLEVILSV